MSVRRPWKLLDPLVYELRGKMASLEPKQLIDTLDAVARMRLDDRSLLEVIEAALERMLDRGLLHEAQAVAPLERHSAVTPPLLRRCSAVTPPLLRRCSVVTRSLPRRCSAVAPSLPGRYPAVAPP